MASVKIKMKSKVYKDLTSPIGLVFIIDRKDKFIQITTAKKKDWDPKKNEVKISDVHCVKKNKQLTTALREAQDYLIDCKIKKVVPSAEAFKNRNAEGTTLKAYIKNYIQKIRSEGKVRTAKKYDNLLNKISRFDSSDIHFASINDKWLAGFIAHLNTYLISGKSPSRNTVQKEIKTLSAIFNKAIQDSTIPDHKNPVAGNIPQGAKTYKTKFTRGEVLMFESYETDHPGLRLAMDTYLIALYLRGIRVTDVLMLEKANYNEDRIFIKENKPPRKEQSIRVDEKCKLILDRWMNESTGKYILPWIPDWVDPYSRDLDLMTRSLNKIESITTIINGRLKEIVARLGIKKNISMHTARHTLGLALAKAKVDIVTIQNVLGHTTAKATDTYIRELTADDELDNAVSDALK